MKKMSLKFNNPFYKGAKLNFQSFSNLELSDENLEFINLNSSTISSSHLQNISFYNASFLSTKFIDINFEMCDLKSSDICSAWINNCQFHKSDFSNSTISDSTFINCLFDGSIFESVSLTRCQFIDCIFETFKIDDSTLALNTFSRCDIRNSQFTESFYYQIFDDCTFHKVSIDANLLGFNFGFSQKTCIQLVNGTNLEELVNDFVSDGLYINAAILRINQVQKYYDETMLACVTAIGQMLQYDILIKADEIEFLKSLTLYFYERKLIAPITILKIWQLLNGYYIVNPSNTSASKAISDIREYANMLYFNFMEFQKELQNNLERLPETSNITDTVELKIVYSEQPTLPLLNILTEFSVLADPRCPMPSLIRTEKGSFVEFHDIAVVIIPYLQTLFAFLGVVIPIVIYKKQKPKSKEQEAETESTIPITKTEIEVTLTTTAVDKSTILIPSTANITQNTSIIVSDVVETLENQQISNSGFCGYNKKNVQSITIRF